MASNDETSPEAPQGSVPGPDRHAQRDRDLKEHNDSVLIRVTLFGVIVTAIVGAAGFWAAYEAHRARIEAGQMGDKSYTLQRETMQLDERPYITALFGGIDKEVLEKTGDDKAEGNVPHLKLIVHGRTPALRINMQMSCTWNGGGHDEWGTMLGTMFEGEPYLGHCWLPLDVAGTLKDRTRKEPMTVGMKGVVTYEDMLHKTYRTPYCYQYVMPEASLRNCTKESPD